MKKVLVMVMLVLGSMAGYGQIPTWEWAKSSQSGITSGGEGYSVASDLNGNAFIGGWFLDTIIFGSYHFNYGKGVYIAKYDSSGNLIWAKCGASLGTNQGIGTGVYADAFGNSYLTGWFNGSILFDSDTLTSTVLNDIFIVKFDSNGNVIWAKSFGGTGNEISTSVAVDLIGNIYLTGYYNLQFIFALDTLNNTLGANFFLAKLDSFGNPIWAKSAMKTCGDIQGFNLAADATGNVYVTGILHLPSCSMSFDSFTLNSMGTYNIFIAKYDFNGNVLWAKCAGSTGFDKAFYVAVDTIGNLYLTGTYSSPSISFDSQILNNSTGSSNAFLVKYDSSGNAIWAKNIIGNNIIGYSVATNKLNKIYLCGGSYMPTNTTVSFDTLTMQYPNGAVDPSFLAGYDTSGNILFAKILASGADDQIALAVTPSGSVYYCGDFHQVNPFIIGNDSLILTCTENVFIAKLGFNNLETTITNVNPTPPQISLYPNPTTSTFTLSYHPSNPNAAFQLLDISGRVVFKQSISGTTGKEIIDASALSNGMYFYQLTSAKESWQGKVVVEK